VTSEQKKKQQNSVYPESGYPDRLGLSR